MKKPLLVLLIAGAATVASAQLPQASPGQPLQTTASASPPPTNRSVYEQRQREEIHGFYFSYDGAPVEAIKSPRHLKIFNPFDSANAGPTPDNTVWADSSKSRAVGWSIFSIRF